MANEGKIIDHRGLLSQLLHGGCLFVREVSEGGVCVVRGGGGGGEEGDAGMLVD